MSRSRRRRPIIATTNCDSEKDDKRKAHRRFRAREREALHHGTHLPLRMEEVSDGFWFGKDGKGWWKPRPDDERYENWRKEMRK